MDAASDVDSVMNSVFFIASCRFGHYSSEHRYIDLDSQILRIDYRVKILVEYLRYDAAVHYDRFAVSHGRYSDDYPS